MYFVCLCIFREDIRSRLLAIATDIFFNMKSKQQKHSVCVRVLLVLDIARKRKVAVSLM